MPKYVIQAEKLSKRYEIGRHARDQRNLREEIAYSATNLFRRGQAEAEIAADPDAHAIWALKDVSFDVEPGDALGVIGANGSGKSTLLKILTRITDPTSGRAEIRGRVGSLLEVGTGFHPELTGRENVYLNGAVLGMRKTDIDRLFDEIVDFAGIDRFLDTPVKKYSSGMYMRLAFAVAAHLEPDILLIDEVLAVGDMAFQKKCMGKMGRVAEQGRTIVFVSHNLSAVCNLCNKVLLLDKGEMKLISTPAEAAGQYLAIDGQKTGIVEWPEGAANSGVTEIGIRAIRVLDHADRVAGEVDVQSGFDVEIQYVVRVPLAGCRVGFDLSAADGTTIFESYDHHFMDLPGDKFPGEYKSRCRVPPKLLKPGKYTLSATAGIYGVKNLAYLAHVVSFDAHDSIYGTGSMAMTLGGFVRPSLSWSIECTSIQAASRKHMEAIPLRRSA